MTRPKRFVLGHHDRFGKIIEVNPNCAVGQPSFEPDFVPNTKAPIHPGRGLLGDLCPGRSVDDKNVVGMLVGRSGEMRVINSSAI